MNDTSPYGDTGEDDMDAPGMDSNMKPKSMPPSATTPTSGNSPKDNLDWGSSNATPNDALLILGAGSKYENKNK